MSPHSTDLEEAAVATDAGWRPDPTGRYEWRYWDGGWTNRVASSRPSGTAERRDRRPGTRRRRRLTPRACPDGRGLPATAARGPGQRPQQHRRSLRSRPAAAADRGSRVTRAAEHRCRSRCRCVPGAPVVGFFTSFVERAGVVPLRSAVDIDPRSPWREHARTATPPTTAGPASSHSPRAASRSARSCPWLSGTIDGIPFERTGFEENHGWSFTIARRRARAARRCSRVRLRPLRWVTMGMALVLAGLTFRDLVHFHDIVVDHERLVVERGRPRHRDVDHGRLRDRGPRRVVPLGERE